MLPKRRICKKKPSAGGAPSVKAAKRKANLKIANSKQSGKTKKVVKKPAETVEKLPQSIKIAKDI